MSELLLKELWLSDEQYNPGPPAPVLWRHVSSKIKVRKTRRKVQHFWPNWFMTWGLFFFKLYEFVLNFFCDFYIKLDMSLNNKCILIKVEKKKKNIPKVKNFWNNWYLGTVYLKLYDFFFFLLFLHQIRQTMSLNNKCILIKVKRKKERTKSRPKVNIFGPINEWLHGLKP